jgi:[citrate (pro-3S)-lyase] ligase
MTTAGRLSLRVHPPLLAEEAEEIAAFRAAAGLEPEAVVPGAPEPYTVCLLDGDRLVAAGSLAGGTIRGLAVDGRERGEGLAATLVSELEAEAARRGGGPLLLFTKPENEATFAALGYRLLASAAGAAILMEKGRGLEDWLSDAASILPAASQRTALVLNANPFTLGHRHLVEEASRRAARDGQSVAVIVVREEASSFPFETRLRLVREGAAEFANVAVLPGSAHVVSRATFPTYFLKQPGEAAAIHARLDLELFGRRIAPPLRIVRRMVGEEPGCATTALYNRAMLELLPPLGVAVEVIPRLESGGVAVSASTVRRLLGEGRVEEACALVPPSTGRFLRSPEAAPVIARIAAGGRH